MSRLFPRIATDTDVASMLRGMADAIERKFVLKDTKLDAKAVAEGIVHSIREMADEVVK